MTKQSCGFAAITTMVALWLGLGAAATAQSRGGVAGAWRLSISFADGARAATLSLEVAGEGVSGRFDSPFSGEVPVKGDFSGGKLVFAGTTTAGPHPGMQMDFSATLDESGKLHGVLSLEMGDFSWTGERPAAQPSVAGTWVMSMMDDHVVPVGLVLEQEGTTITGTLHVHGREIPIRGSFIGGKLSLTVEDTTEDGVAHRLGRLDIVAAVKEDGTLAGEVTGSRGTVAMTAERLNRRG